MVGMSPAWFIDAWSVRDGMAFASQRAADARLQTRRCIYLAVPALEPEPVSGPSAALWASRAGFQLGFRDEEGFEIGLPDVAALRELVRRGYLAGGIGPGPEGPVGEPPPPDDDGPDSPSAMLERGFHALRESRANYAGSSALADPGHRMSFLSELTSPAWVDVVYQHLRVFGEATLRALSQEQAALQDDDAAIDDVMLWGALLYRAGLWPTPTDFADAMQRHSRTSGLEGFHSLWDLQTLLAAPPAGLEGNRMPQLLLRVPCPLRPGWDRRIRRLGDKLYLATAMHDYFEHNEELPDLTPVLLAALAATTAVRASWRGPWRVDRRACLKAGLLWLFEQLPQSALPSTAERQLIAFALNQLGPR